MRPLAVIGNVNVDLILGPLAPWPQPGTETMVEHDDLRIGGAAGNAALTWQASGAPFVIAANVGEDAFGQWLRDAFGRRADAWTTAPARTTVSVGVTHPEGERTFLTTHGHLPHMRWPAIRAQLDDAPLTGGLLLLCGANVTPALRSDYLAIFDWADAQGVAVALDTGWPVDGWTAAARAEIAGWTARSRYLLLNEIEAMGLTQTETVAAAVAELADTLPPGGVAVVKAGPQGAFAGGSHGPLHVQAPQVSVIDTIGAGDVFNAGFLAALAQGADLETAMHAGVTMASRAISTAPRQYDPPSARVA